MRIVDRDMQHCSTKNTLKDDAISSLASHFTDNIDNKTNESISNIKEATSHPTNVILSEAGENDVLLGRGPGTTNHKGNVTFRTIVKQHKGRYLGARNNYEKCMIVMEVKQKVKSLSPPGRFIRQHNAEANTWIEINDDEIKQKISQALREKVPYVRKYKGKLNKNKTALLTNAESEETSVNNDLNSSNAGDTNKDNAKTSIPRKRKRLANGDNRDDDDESAYPSPSTNNMEKIPTSFNCFKTDKKKNKTKNKPKIKSEKPKINNPSTIISEAKINQNNSEIGATEENDSDKSIEEEEGNNLDNAKGGYNFQEAIARIIRASKCVDDSDQGSCRRGHEELSSVEDDTDSMIISKLEEKSEDIDNPTSAKTDSKRLSPVLSDVTTTEKATDQNQILALPEIIEKNQKEFDGAHQERLLTKCDPQENQKESLQDTIKKLQQERDEANQQKVATKRKMEEMVLSHEKEVNDINKKWSKRVKTMEEKFRFAALQKELVMKKTMEKILSSEKKKFRIYKNIWKQKKQLYQSNTFALKQQLSSDSSSSEDDDDDDGCDAEDLLSFSNGNKRNFNAQCRSTDGKKRVPSEVEDEYGHEKIDEDLPVASMAK